MVKTTKNGTYKTSDGKEFKSLDKANKRDMELLVTKALKGLYHEDHCIKVNERIRKSKVARKCLREVLAYWGDQD